MYKVILAIIIIFLTACTPKINITDILQNSDSQTLNNNEVTLNDVLKAEKVIALKNDNTLYLVDPEYSKPVAVYNFDNNEKPNGGNMDTFLISPSKNWIVWYTPLKGILALNLQTLKTKVVQQADDFLNSYPYFEFSKDKDVLKFIIDKGNTFLQINLETFDKQPVNIPYPYGNVFKTSIDESAILFVSGYAQNPKATFMVTDAKGNFVTQFSANINLTDRHQVFWAPDGSGVFLINSNKLQLYPISGPQSPQDFYTFTDDVKIISAAIIDQQIFTFTNDGYWHVISFNDRKEIARTPMEIASELQKPKFYPWVDNHFLIEEIVSNNPSQFNRLWLSDFRGVKKIVMEKYNEAIIKTFPEKID